VTEDLEVGGAPGAVQKVEGGRNLARDLFLATLSGGLLVLAFPRVDLGPVAFVALVPLLLAIRGATWRSAAGLGFLAGFVFFLGTLYWLAPTVVRYGGLPWAAATGILLILAGYLALYVAGFAAGVVILGHRGTAFVLAAAALWVALELVRSHLLTGFPWNLLGHSQYRNLPLIQIAAVTGVYGVSFLVVAVNAAIADVLSFPSTWRRAVPSATTTVLLVTGALAYSWAVPIGSGPEAMRVTLVQGNIPQGIKWEPGYQDATLGVYRALTLREAGRLPDLVIWPETAVPFFLRQDSRRPAVEGLAAEIGAPLLVGAPDLEGPPSSRYTNSAFLITPQGGIVRKYDKVHLVPFGEYVPLKGILSFVNKLAQGTIGDFAPGIEFTVFSIPAGRFGVTISYEVYFPAQVRQYVRNGAEFLVNITNDAWYGRTAAPYQHVAMMVFRAVENRRYLVRAANTGISAVVAPDGRIVKASGLFERTTITGVIAPRAGLTAYARYGDIFALVAAAAVGFGLIAALVARFRPMGAQVLVPRVPGVQVLDGKKRS
jgi:apolipoprotein N-acyltransferase